MHSIRDSLRPWTRPTARIVVPSLATAIEEPTSPRLAYPPLYGCSFDRQLVASRHDSHWQNKTKQALLPGHPRPKLRVPRGCILVGSESIMSSVESWKRHSSIHAPAALSNTQLEWTLHCRQIVDHCRAKSQDPKHNMLLVFSCCRSYFCPSADTIVKRMTQDGQESSWRTNCWDQSRADHFAVHCTAGA
jgi:hypothetical protein